MEATTAATRVRRFEAQVLPHLPDLYRAARRLTGTTPDAEDLVQETCLRAFRALDQLRSADAAKAWVFTVLRSVFLRNAARWLPRAADREPVEGDSWAPYGDDRHSPWRVALIEEARHAIQRLPVAFREVTVLAHIGGFSYREIAEILGIPVGTVMSRLFRARELLRAALVGSVQSDRSEMQR
jgi:RNA polymerase sigma-70 factor (ECF subfamily)